MTRKLFAFLLSICLLLSLPALSACTGPAVPPQAESAIASVAPSVTDGLPQPDTSISEISAADSTSEPGTAPATTAVPTTQHSTAARPTTTAQPSLSVVDAIKAQNTSTLSGTDKQVADEAISIIKSMIPSGMSVFDKAKTIHDYMDYHFCYDIDNYNAGTIPDRDYTIAGVLLYGTGVCEGFAETYQLFMNV
ncbi:MAG: hypothetical protein FWF49_05400, partial [Oscillospiraceae bacterium]|nr:hypothetical protein [Oscillospiraceae bacterium]